MIGNDIVRGLLHRHGKTMPQTLDDWKGPYPLPKSVADFYLKVGPIDIYITGYGNDYFLPRLSKLWEFQQGYSYDSQAMTKLAGWDDDWLVVAEEGGDAFIAAKSNEEILHAFHGAGTWEPKVLFPEIFTMAACLATLGIIANQAGEDFTDDQCFIRSVHKAEALNRLTELLTSKEFALTALKALGWD